MAALALVSSFAFAATAQQSTEFGRASGPELVMKTKGSAPISGSLELSMSTGNDIFGRGSSTPGYGLSAGGALVQDRLWFFASASRQESSRFTALPDNAASARIDSHVGSNHDFSAFFEAAKRPQLTMTNTGSFENLAVPSTFLSLRYTGIVSNTMFFTANLTQKK
ncbi:MAG TPA: hypothetical protein VF608_13660 [Thermoanaerobaculia bacterium]